MSERTIEPKLLEQLTRNAVEQISGMEFIMLAMKSVEQGVKRQVEEMSDEDFEKLEKEIEADWIREGTVYLDALVWTNH